MTNDNHVSSIFLLILIGLAIYFLINPFEGFSNKNINDSEYLDINNIEDFENSDALSSDNEPEKNNESNPNYISNSDSISSSDILPNSDYLSNSYDLNTSNNEKPINYESTPYVSEEVISEIINSSNAPTITSQNAPTLFEPKNKPVQPTVVASQPPKEQPIVLSESQNVAFNFDPNDDSFDMDGTDLSTAFINPLPPNSQPDKVDLKKNNNKNYNAKDFLPKQVNDEWFETDFSLAKYQLNDDKLINTEKYIIGINTVGESLKNASYDIRGTIPNPKFIVSPWNNSTYEPDFNLKPLC